MIIAVLHFFFFFASGPHSGTLGALPTVLLLRPLHLFLYIHAEKFKTGTKEGH